MLEFIILIGFLAIFTGGIYFYRMTIKAAPVKIIEARVARDMETRSHRLCMRACYIDTMADTYERIAADELLRDDIHQYVADFEAEVADRLKKSKLTGVNAYGGIKLH